MSQSGLGTDDNEEVLCIFETSLSDRLMLYQDTR